MLRRWRFFGEFFASCISAIRVQQFSALHPKFALRPHHVWKYGIHATKTFQLLGDFAKYPISGR